MLRMLGEARRELHFTPEEWSIIAGLASPQDGAGSRIGWYASILTPIVLFCGYGLWTGEITAVGLAFACLAGCVIWSVVGEIRSLKVYRSIGTKIVAFVESQKP